MLQLKKQKKGVTEHYDIVLKAFYMVDYCILEIIFGKLYIVHM